MVETKDIVIIGSGPSGTMASIEAAKRGADVLVLENDPIVGDPNHCSGLITVKGLNNLGVPYPRRIIENSVNAVNFYSPSQYKLSIKRAKDKEIHVFQRNELDRVLFKYAIEKFNVEGRFNSRVTSLIKEEGKISGVNVKPKGEKSYSIKSKVVIDASGSLAKFLPQAGLKPPDPKWRLPAMQFELDNVYDFPKNYVELYHGSKWAPGFFAWIIPTCGDSVRIGLATWKSRRLNLKKLLKNFMVNHPVASKKLKDSKIVKVRGGVVTASGPINKSYSSGYLAVGDVAGQVKATTGGGVNIGGYCGRIAGTIASNYIKDPMKASLSAYEIEWKRLFWKELKGMEYYRKVIGLVDDKTLDILFQAGINSHFSNLLSETKDIDMHTFDLMKAALKSIRPSLIMAGVRTTPILSLRFFQQLLS
jgi:geranylgeranyl reductase family protein